MDGASGDADGDGAAAHGFGSAPAGTAAMSEVGTGAVPAVSPSQHGAWLTPCIGHPEVTQAACPWM